MSIEIGCRNDRGKFEPAPILSPLASTIAPALEARSTRISVAVLRQSQVGSSKGIQLTYSLPGGKRRRGTLPKDFSPFVLRTRLRIVAQISIVRREPCHGRMYIRMAQGVLPVAVKAETTQRQDRFTLLPEWSSIEELG